MTTISLVPSDATVDAWADGVKMLQRMLAPKGFASDRWALICSDCARLLEQHGADLLRLGWSTVDAFGAHPDAPAAAVRCYGFGLLLNGGQVVEFTEHGAVARAHSGARLMFTRVPNAGAVPTWAVQ